MSIESQGHFFTIYFPGFVCFMLYLGKISGERLQDHLVLWFLFVSSTESLICELLVDAVIRPSFIFHMNFIQMDGFEWLPGRHKGQLHAKYSTILFLETRKGMEVVLYINIHYISLYMNSVFINIHMEKS